jgi:hypothetical protein
MLHLTELCCTLQSYAAPYRASLYLTELRCTLQSYTVPYHQCTQIKHWLKWSLKKSLLWHCPFKKNIFKNRFDTKLCSTAVDNVKYGWTLTFFKQRGTQNFIQEAPLGNNGNNNSTKKKTDNSTKKKTKQYEKEDITVRKRRQKQYQKEDLHSTQPSFTLVKKHRTKNPSYTGVRKVSPTHNIVQQK